MVKYVGLIVAKIADGVFSEVGVVEGQYLKVGEAIQIEDFLEATDLVAADVKIMERHKIVQAGLNAVDLVSSNPELL